MGFRPLRSREEEARFTYGSLAQDEDKKIEEWGAISRRNRYLQHQFPLHDIDRRHCHDMTQAEKQL